MSLESVARRRRARRHLRTPNADKWLGAGFRAASTMRTLLAKKEAESRMFNAPARACLAAAIAASRSSRKSRQELESPADIVITSENGEGEGSEHPSPSHGGPTMSRVMSTPPQPTATRTTTPMPTHEQIAMRAYERWVKQGRPQGTEKQDWFEAETDLKREMMAGAGRR